MPHGWSANARGRRECAPRGEHGKPAKNHLLLVRQLVVAPGDGIVQRLMAPRQIARASLQREWIGLQPLPQLLGGEHPRPWRSQLDRQRQAIQAMANAGDGGGALAGQGEGCICRPRARDEERHRRDRLQLPDVGNAGHIRQRQRRNGDRPLTAHVQPLPASDEHVQLWKRCQQFGDQQSGGDEVLEVVEHVQQRLAVQRLAPALAQWPLTHVLDANGAGHDRADQLDVPHRRQRNKGDARGEVGNEPGGDVEGQARLADASGAAQGDETHVWAAEESADRLDFASASDQGGQRNRQRSRQELTTTGDDAHWCAGWGRLRNHDCPAPSATSGAEWHLMVSYGIRV
jgi:hypothetical protein